MAIKSIIALGLAGLLGCSSQEEQKIDYSTLAVSNTYEIENSGCANVANIGMVCYRGINENKEAVLEIIADETTQLAYKISPAEQLLVDKDKMTATFRMDYASNSRIDITITQIQKKEEKTK
ncbi:MAG: hypothetical protein WC852_04800 [Candidatus Nanoarchaeia archaeon]|jgi:hypothetical protein